MQLLEGLRAKKNQETSKAGLDIKQQHQWCQLKKGNFITVSRYAKGEAEETNREK